MKCTAFCNSLHPSSNHYLFTVGGQVAVGGGQPADRGACPLNVRPAERDFYARKSSRCPAAALRKNFTIDAVKTRDFRRHSCTACPNSWVRWSDGWQCGCGRRGNGIQTALEQLSESFSTHNRHIFVLKLYCHNQLCALTIVVCSGAWHVCAVLHTHLVFSQ